MREFQRAKGMGQYQGMDIDVIGADEIVKRYPFIDTHDLKGALYDPNDGDIDPAQLTQALAKGARDLGAKIVRFCQRGRLPRRGGRQDVRPRYPHDGDEPSIHIVRGNPRTGRMVKGSWPQAAAAA
jgi:glycine/D-amino acid oxidase-like deaminating enzyme